MSPAKKTNWNQVNREAVEIRQNAQRIIKYQGLIQAVVAAAPIEYIDLSTKKAKPIDEATKEELDKSFKRITEIYNSFGSETAGLSKIVSYRNLLLSEIQKR
jgi:hypothetical protein